MSKSGLLFMLCATLFASGVSAEAQQARKMARIGFLGQPEGPSAAYEVFRQTLRDLGYREGTTFSVEYLPDDFMSSLDEKANKLVQLKVRRHCNHRRHLNAGCSKSYKDDPYCFHFQR